MTPKTYTVTVKATDLFRETTKTFTLVIKTDNPPQVQITKPTLGQTFIGTKTIEITAFAIDDRELKSITIYVDDKKIGKTYPNAKSYTFSKTVTLDYGTHYAYAEACDVFGCNKSENVTFTISEEGAPYIKITYLYNNQKFVTLQDNLTIPIFVYARDDVKISKITLKVDGYTVIAKNYSSQVATLSTSVTMDIGSHTITAIAEDNSGKTDTDTITIYVEKIKRNMATPPKIVAFSIPEINWLKNANSAKVVGG